METKYPIGKQYVEDLLKKDRWMLTPNQNELCFVYTEHSETLNMEELYRVVEEAVRSGKEVLVGPIKDIPHSDNEIVFARELNRDFPDHDLAEFYESRKMYEEALHHYELAIRKDEDPSGVAYREAGYLCLHKLKDFDRAMYFFTNLGREPVEENEYVDEMYIEQGRYEEALEIYRLFFPKFVLSVLKHSDGDSGIIFLERKCVEVRASNIERCYEKLNLPPDRWDIWFTASYNYFDLLSGEDYYGKEPTYLYE